MYISLIIIKMKYEKQYIRIMVKETNIEIKAKILNSFLKIKIIIKSIECTTFNIILSFLFL
jgi:hypothetical protein